jgi:hypothetical protein
MQPRHNSIPLCRFRHKARVKLQGKKFHSKPLGAGRSHVLAAETKLPAIVLSV